VLKRFPPKPKYDKNGAVIKAARIIPASARVGITVGGKVGNAVVRNKLRRRLKEICRLNSARFLGGFDLVIIARDAAAAARYAELNRDLMYLADKLGVTVDAGRGGNVK
jgi:RNase P protein component